MNYIDREIEKLFISKYVPVPQHSRFLQKRIEKEENEIYEQNKHVPNT